MDTRRQSRGGDRDHDLLGGSRGGQSVARYFAREREKRELRRERDVVVVRLAGNLGMGMLARELDVAPAVASKLVADARERLNADTTITVRRARRDRERWADVDTYFEALGSRAGMLRSRRMPPQA
jgi:hypothetical protein